MPASGERRLPTNPSIVRESPIDLTELCRLGDTATGDTSRNFVHDIIELFLQLAPEIYNTTRAAFADGDSQSIARAAHKLKSQAAYLGAQRMVHVCKQIEQLGYEVGEAAPAVTAREERWSRRHNELMRNVNFLRLRLVQERGRELRFALARRLRDPVKRAR